MMFFWVLAPCRLAGRSRSFGETYSLHFRGWKRLGETYYFHLQGWRSRQYVSPKRWHLPESLHGTKTLEINIINKWINHRTYNSGETQNLVGEIRLLFRLREEQALTSVGLLEWSVHTVHVRSSPFCSAHCNRLSNVNLIRIFCLLISYKNVNIKTCTSMILPAIFMGMKLVPQSKGEI
jgi:hypothetical protein